jgi:hypothetical protein
MQQPHVQPFVPGIAFHRNRDTAPAYWMLDLLWLIPADGRETGGAYSILEQFDASGFRPSPSRTSIPSTIGSTSSRAN